MEQVITFLDEKVDYYLLKISHASNLTVTTQQLYDVPYMSEDHYLIDQFMIEKGLIKAEKENRLLTSKGLEIANFGGWLTYTKQLKSERHNIIRKELQPKNNGLDLEHLRCQVQNLQKEVAKLEEKEVASSQLARNLLIQNRNTSIMMLIIGAVLGFTLANLKWLIELISH